MWLTIYDRIHKPNLDKELHWMFNVLGVDQRASDNVALSLMSPLKELSQSGRLLFIIHRRHKLKLEYNSCKITVTKRQS